MESEGLSGRRYSVRELVEFEDTVLRENGREESARRKEEFM